MAAENGIEIEYLRKRNVRKEDRVQAVLVQRGDHPGMVGILSAMEPCSDLGTWAMVIPERREPEWPSEESEDGLASNLATGQGTVLPDL